MRLCEVMVKDIDDSRRINSAIASNLKYPKVENNPAKDSKEAKEAVPAIPAVPAVPAEPAEPASTTSNGLFALDATIVSRHFWPTLQGGNLSLHPTVQKQFDSFGKEYATLKVGYRQAIGRL